MDSLLQHNLFIDGGQHFIYGDAVYMMKPWLQIAFPRQSATLAQTSFNKRMSSVREAVNWPHKDLNLMFINREVYFSEHETKLYKLRSSYILDLCLFWLLFNFEKCLGHGSQVNSMFRSAAKPRRHLAPLPL